MNRTSRSIRLLCAGVAITVTFALFNSVALLARPAATEQLAHAKKASVLVATARDAGGRRR